MIYMRFPGQSTGQYVLAEMDQQGRPLRFISTNKEKEFLSRLAWLLVDAGTTSLKATFDSIHPALNLRDHLTQPHIKSVLMRLQQQGVLNETQWELLYPPKKKHTSSQKYDSKTLITLLETICHLCPPYPNGWMSAPLPTDSSLSADIVRLQLLHQEVAKYETMPVEAFSNLWKQCCDVLLRLGGPPIRVKIHRIEHEVITPDMQSHYIQQLMEQWGKSTDNVFLRIHASRVKSNRTKGNYKDKHDDYDGLPPEEKVSLQKTYRLFVDNIVAEDILDRLQQSQVIKFSDRQEILALSKNTDRMHLLLDKIINTKLSYAFKALCDAIKFKSKKTYEEVMQIRKQVYKQGVVDHIDVVRIIQEALTDHYKNMWTRTYPFPWDDKHHASIRDIYAPLDIVDIEGKRLHASDILPPSPTNGRGQRIVLEGHSGSGKSTLCAWLAYIWATQGNYFKNKFNILLCVDAHTLNGSMEESIYRSLFPENFKLNLADFWSAIEEHSSEVIMILDGFDQSNGVDFSDILSGRKLRNSTVIVTGTPEFSCGIDFVPDRKIFNMGLNDNNIKRCIRTCVTLSRLDQDNFEKLYSLIADDSWEFHQFLSSPQVCVLLFQVYSILRNEINLRDVRTLTDLMEKYGIAMGSLYCRKQKIDILGFEFPDEVLQAAVHLDEFAFISMMNHRNVFTEDDVLKETKTNMVLRFGAFKKSPQGLRFSSSLVQDFLAAKYLADCVLEDVIRVFEERRMIRSPKYAQLMSFLCALYRSDYDTPFLKTLFTEFAARNARCIRYVPSDVSEAASSVDIELKQKPSRGELQDFSQGLQSLAECLGREDVCEIIAASLPQRLIIRRESMIPYNCIKGLWYVLHCKANTVCEVEINLYPFFIHQMKFLTTIAVAIGACEQITSLRCYWLSLELISKYLDIILKESKSVESIMLEDTTRRQVKQITAATWATLQSACQNMSKLKQLSFLRGKVAAIVYHVIHHMPSTIESLDFTGCVMNLMCASELSAKLENSKSLQVLDLSFTRLNSTEFVAILQGLKMCDKIRDLKLCGAKLDRPGLSALADCLKITKSIKSLDLSECELRTEMCKKLANAIAQNRTVSKLILRNTKLTSEGHYAISTPKIAHVEVEGLEDIYHPPIHNT
ncbi:hypothetical protein CHS0354_024867 [Potamilus streckersoni]|uniref:CARD domain-containing protein n=1 Tax=Potamilus streckersoni TaxID=2493646 RepID=A0AAE0SQU6_9BIVA|nr:hypothetical protein CHS0354_024867 [Potamilus streckersoni]